MLCINYITFFLFLCFCLFYMFLSSFCRCHSVSSLLLLSQEPVVSLLCCYSLCLWLLQLMLHGYLLEPFWSFLPLLFKLQFFMAHSVFYSILFYSVMHDYSSTRLCPVAIHFLPKIMVIALRECKP